MSMSSGGKHPRNPYVVDARSRKGGAMRHRTTLRAGARSTEQMLKQLGALTSAEMEAIECEVVTMEEMHAWEQEEG